MKNLIPRDKPFDMLASEWVAIHQDIREPNVLNPEFLKELKAIVVELAGWRIDRPVARIRMKEFLNRAGYSPEGGFPNDPPEWKITAVPGSIDDLGSFDRLDWTIRHQEEIIYGARDKFGGEEPQMLEQFPAWKLWAKPEVYDVVRTRWEAVGGILVPPLEGEDTSDPPSMVALKSDKIWELLGSSSIWDDGLDLDHPPFYLNSGISWAAVDKGDAIEYGLMESSILFASLSDQEKEMLKRVRCRRVERRKRYRILIDEAIREANEEFANRSNLNEMIAKEKERYKRHFDF